MTLFPCILYCYKLDHMFVINLRKLKSYQASFLKQCYEIRNQLQKKNPTNTWRLNDMLLNNQWITEEIKEESKKYLETNDNKKTPDDPKPMGCSKSRSKREVYSNTILP